MYKVVTAYKRKPGMEVEAFQRYWLENHAPIAATLPGLRRYVQSHSLLQGYRKADLPCDGMSEMWFDSRQAWQQALADPAAAVVLADERAFIDVSRKVVMPVEALVIKYGAIPANGVKNVTARSPRKSGRCAGTSKIIFSCTNTVKAARRQRLTASPSRGSTQPRG